MNDSDFRELVERVKERTDITEVISQHLDLNKHNMAICPFHDDHTPSFSVNSKEQYFHCFGCDVGGNVFKFLELYEHKSFWEVLLELAQKAGIPIHSLSPEDRKRFEESRVTEEILTLTTKFYHDRLTPEVKEYLIKERGITDKSISLYKIGYALGSEMRNNGDLSLLNCLTEQGYTKSQAVKAGVLRDDESEYFSGCIIFPNLHYGKVVYITGRGYPEKFHRKPLKDKLQLKHLFCEPVLREKKVIITEGEIDTYTLMQAGFNACGILGVGSFKEEWIRRFKNVETVYISLDGDPAGIEAALKLGELFGSKARIVAFPKLTDSGEDEVKDWNELFVKKYQADVQAFQKTYQQLLDQAQTVLEFKIRQIPKSTPKRDISVVLSPIFVQVAELGAVEQEFYIDIIVDHFQDTLKISRQAIKNDIQRTRKERPVINNDNLEILGDDQPRISPALDFQDGVGYVSVPLDVKLTTTIKGKPLTKIAVVPFLVTSNKEFTRLDELELLESKGLILKSQPFFLDSNRWLPKHIETFRETGFEVKPAHVFEMIRDTYENHLDFKEPHTSDIIALWTIGTYFYPIFESYPYVSFTGERGSGKTKTLNVAEKLCFNAVCSSDMSSALLFRIIEGSSCTVLIDEAERLRDKKQSQEFRLLLNAGYKRGGRAHRSKPDTFEPQSFSVYSPKMIANIKGLEEVLENRCISFIMLRTMNTEKANTVVNESGRDWPYIRHLLYAFGLSFFQEIQEIYLTDQALKQIRAISGREGELWHPLLAIARFLDQNGCSGLFEQIKAVAIAKAEETKMSGLDERTNAMLLALQELTQNNETDISNRKIKEKMIDFLEDEENSPSPHWIGRALKRFGLIEHSQRRNKGYQYIIRHKTVDDVIDRYGV